MMMGTSSSSSNSSSSNLNPNVVFTAAQWEELEQQALIYKYMVSGVPVPTDLLLSVRRSLYNSTFASSSSSSLSHHPTLGMWEGSLQYNHQLYGYGRKIDLEPGRCRRTDGKKWRCSKEAYPDSKYCEKHMHRGRNRSRKPVEFSSSSSSSSSSTITAAATNVINVSSTPSVTISKSLVDTYSQVSSNHTSFMDYRYLEGMKDSRDDERSAANNNNYFQLNNHQNYVSHFNFQNLKEQQNKGEETQIRQHCFVMGTDFIKSTEDEPNKLNETSSKQPFHHFFATPNTNHEPNWVDVVDQHHHINPPKSPLSTQDLFESKPRPYW